MTLRTTIICFLGALSAILPSAADCQPAADPLRKMGKILTADQLVMVWSQDNGSGQQYADLKIYDPNLLGPSLTPKTKQTDSRMGNNEKLAIATGNFLNGSYDNIVAAWATQNDSIQIIVPNVVHSTLSWSTTNRVTMRGPLMPTSKSINSSIHLAAGNFFGSHADEFVLGYHGADSAITLVVFSFNGSSLVPQQQSSIKVAKIPVGTAGRDSWDLAVGDYNADGYDEISVGYVDGSTGALKVAIFGVTAGGAIVPQTSKTISASLPGGPLNIALASGDFDGASPADKIALCVGTFPPNGSNAISLYLIQTDSTGAIVSNTGRSATVQNSDANALDPLCIAAGDVNGDGRDDIAVGWSTKLLIFASNDTLQPALRRTIDTGPWSSQGSVTNYSDAFVAVGDLNRDHKAEIIFGKNLYENIDGQNQSFQIKVYSNTTTSDTAFSNISSTPYMTLSNEETAPDGSNLGIARHFALAVGDFSGKDVRIGTAIHYQKTGVQQPMVILNAPPIHFDKFAGDSIVYDLTSCFPSQSCGFSSQYVNTQTSTASLTTEVHSDWGVSATLGAGGEFGPIGVEASVTAKYGQGFGKTRGSSRSFSITIGQTADRDDYLLANVVAYDIYEYPVYDSTNATPKGWVMVLIPGTVEPQWNSSKDAIRNFVGSAFRPDHEVGNVLSYPSTTPGAVQGFLYQPVQALTVSGSGSGFQQISYTTFVDSGWSKSENLGVEVGAKVSGFGIEASVQGDYSQSNLSTQTNQVSTQLMITANTGSLASAFSASALYRVRPTFYWSASGALVIDYIVQPTDLVGSFWTAKYGSKTDLTFSLPWINDPERGLPLPNNDPEYRYRTEDIYLSLADPQPGDTVTITAKVRNYALSDAATPVKVRFFKGDPSAGGTKIGEASIASGVKARGNATVSIPWTVPAGTARTTRIYALIDPDSAITNEVHKNNNRGWTPVSDFAALTTGVSGNPSAALPRTFSLEQAYPNPFNPSTNIEFRIGERVPVRLVVYDILGREVAVLVNEVKGPGVYAAKFDGSNLASGMYLYRITAGGFSQVKKMLMIK